MKTVIDVKGKLQNIWSLSIDIKVIVREEITLRHQSSSMISGSIFGDESV